MFGSRIRPPALARALHRRLETLRKIHRHQRLHARLARLVVVEVLVHRAHRIGVDQRLVHLALEIDRRHLVREHSPVGEELPQVDRHVAPREEGPQRRFRNLVQRLVGGGADLGIAILDQQHEDRQLLVRARRQRAGRRLHAHVAIDLAPFEQIEQRRRATHQRACT